MEKQAYRKEDAEIIEDILHIGQALREQAKRLSHLESTAELALVQWELEHAEWGVC